MSPDRSLVVARLCQVPSKYIHSFDTCALPARHSLQVLAGLVALGALVVFIMVNSGVLVRWVLEAHTSLCPLPCASSHAVFNCHTVHASLLRVRWQAHARLALHCVSVAPALFNCQ
jgi:hypothetical protein